MRTHSSKFALGVVALLVALSVPSSAVHAQPASDVDAAQRADALFAKGKALYKIGKNREAYEALLSAWSSKKSYDIAANLGSAELSLARPRDAAEHFAYALRTFPATGNKTQLAAAKQLFNQARAQVGGLSIKVSADGAEVLIDGKSIGRAPIQEEIFVNPGERTVEARLAGYESSQQSAKVEKGASLPITLKLSVSPTPVAPPAPSTSASVAPTVPLASASASASPPPAPTGSTAPIVPAGAGDPSKPVVITGGVVTGLAVVTGVVFTVIANGKASDADTMLGEITKQRGPSACAQFDAPGCADLHDALSAKQTLGSAAAWSFIGGGVLGAATLAYTLLTPKRTSTGIVVAPVVTSAQTGLVVHGTF